MSLRLVYCHTSVKLVKHGHLRRSPLCAKSKQGLHACCLLYYFFSTEFKWRPALRRTTESIFLGGYSQIIGGIYPPRVSALLLETDDFAYFLVSISSLPVVGAQPGKTLAKRTPKSTCAGVVRQTQSAWFIRTKNLYHIHAVP